MAAESSKARKFASLAKVQKYLKFANPLTTDHSPVTLTAYFNIQFLTFIITLAY